MESVNNGAEGFVSKGHDWKKEYTRRRINNTMINSDVIPLPL